MNSLRLCLLHTRGWMISARRSVSTDMVLLARSRRSSPRFTDDPGIRHHKDLHREDAEFLQGLEVPEEINPEPDFMNIDVEYDNHFKEKKEQKARLRKILTAKLFFEPRPQPLMLTYNDIQCIRFLYKYDPAQWNEETLSDSFPATPQTIKKVLKGKWKCSAERAKKRDAIVQKNWELLAEGKLNADPDVIEHLKKFANRKEILLEQIKNEKFLVPEVKEEHVWNNGEMSSIIAHYEKAINKIYKEQSDKLNNKLLTDGSESNESETAEKNSIDKLHEKVNEASLKKCVKGKESFLLKKMVQAFEKNVTLAELQSKILKRAEAKERLDLSEKAILESQLGNTGKKNFVYNKKATEESVEGHPASTTKRSSSYTAQERQQIKDALKMTKKFAESETEVKLECVEIKHDPVLSEEEEENLRMKFMFSSSDDQQEIPKPDSRTQFITESEIGKFLNQENANKISWIKEEKEEDKPKEKTDVDNVEDDNRIIDPEKLRREELYYNMQEEDIKNTPFWSSSSKSQSKALLEFEKAPLQVPEEPQQVTKVGFSNFDDYPLRIKIPKDKQGSGLTFKINDCYYDDDGEFLYRVPGMTK